MKVAFYKGKGGWTDKLIRFWTLSQYSHCEIVIGDYWYSSSWYDGGVRRKKIDYNPESWDFIEVPYDESIIVEFFHQTQGKEYDLKGIVLSQIFPFKTQDMDKYYCSEWCAIALGLKDTIVSPEELWEELNK